LIIIINNNNINIFNFFSRIIQLELEKLPIFNQLTGEIVWFRELRREKEFDLVRGFEIK
jgi:hypothetical protein